MSANAPGDSRGASPPDSVSQNWGRSQRIACGLGQQLTYCSREHNPNDSQNHPKNKPLYLSIIPTPGPVSLAMAPVCRAQMMSPNATVTCPHRLYHPSSWTGTTGNEVTGQEGFRRRGLCSTGEGVGIPLSTRGKKGPFPRVVTRVTRVSTCGANVGAPVPWHQGARNAPKAGRPTPYRSSGLRGRSAAPQL